MERKRTASSGKNSRDFGTVLLGLRGMSGHALTVLDFHGALEQVAGHATFEAGRAAVLSLRPQADREWVERELTRVSETEAFLKACSTWLSPEIPDCLPLFERLVVEGSVLDGLELRALEREETREIHRVLSEITQTLRPLHPSLTASWEALVDFDSLAARARAASEWGACRPALSGESDGWMIVRGRHPLLLASSDDPVVPFDLSLESGERIVVVSGPNTGVKSVFLKAVGLIASLTQSGVVPPVEEGTRLPIFDSIFADIGDEQSIMENLSTFSAHLAVWKEVVESAGNGSLVLLDEMGTGTDPAEGAALSRALIEHLSQRGATAVVTSHLGALKRLDSEGSAVVNAALQFDPDGMKPTFELIKGRPGRSYGLATAHRLGLPAHVLERAEFHMEGGEASMEDFLTGLEKKEKEALELVDKLSREREETAGLRAEVEAREAELRHSEREAERRAREEARRILMEARREVEEAIREVREASSAKELESAARSARQRVEDAARRQKELRPGGLRGSGSTTLTPGDRVRLLDGGLKVVVAEVRDDRVVIDASGIRMKVHIADLELVNQEDAARDTSAGSVLWKAPDGPVHTEVDLRRYRGELRRLLKKYSGSRTGRLCAFRQGTTTRRSSATARRRDAGSTAQPPCAHEQE